MYRGHISTVTLGNLTGVVALTWEFGANGYITELMISSPW